MLDRIFDKKYTGYSLICRGLFGDFDLTDSFHIMNINLSFATEFSKIPIEAGQPISENAIRSGMTGSIALTAKNDMSLGERVVEGLQQIGNELLGTQYKINEKLIEKYKIIDDIYKNAYKLVLMTPFYTFENLVFENININEINVDNNMRYFDYTISIKTLATFAIQKRQKKVIIAPQKTNIVKSQKKKVFKRKKTEHTQLAQRTCEVQFIEKPTQVVQNSGLNYTPMTNNRLKV